MQSYPTNTGMKWTSEEEARLLIASTSGVAVSTIARIHRRTIGAIQSRLLRIAMVYLSEGMTVSDASRLTGLPSLYIQISAKPDSGRVSPPTMFTTTLSREELAGLPAKYRIDTIRNYIEHNLTSHVQSSATLGKTSYLFVFKPRPPHPTQYTVTLADVIEGATAKFPGCKVGFSDEWVDVRPGVREHREGVLVDWS